MSPKVSVLMPVYNTEEKYLRGAIESVLNQTFTDFEFLIINDASTDKNVAAVVKSYMGDDSRIKYFENEKNLGISDTRNKLIKTALGEYLAVMDHDDISLPERFKKQVAFLDANPDYGVISCHGGRSSSRRFEKMLIEDEQIRLGLISHCAIWHSACMIRKSVLIENNIFYEADFSPAEDYALFCRLIPYTKFHNIPEVLFFYNEYSKQTSAVKKQKMEMMDYKVRAFVAKDNPALVDRYKRLIPSFTYVKLFGFIPILKIKSYSRKNTVYLFFVLPILTYKTRKLGKYLA